jgi:hypothetical protein
VPTNMDKIYSLGFVGIYNPHSVCYMNAML